MSGAVLTLVALGLAAAPPASRPVGRADVAALEKRFDQRLTSFAVDDPIELLGNTRGVYIDGYGVVFSTEVSLAPAPALTPFRPSIPRDQVNRVRDKKLTRLPSLKKLMLELMASSAATLRDLPPQEQIVFGVTLHYWSWEDTTGLPAQIVMQAPRKSLIDRAPVETSVRVREF
ncbi:MAG: hypothetical protein ACRD44_18140 [Bryobacteraceae bacterium]